jgi:hypothetical protein
MPDDEDARLADARDREVYAIRRAERELAEQERRLERRLDGLEDHAEHDVDHDLDQLDPGGRPPHKPFWDDEDDPRNRRGRRPRPRR